MTRAEEAMQAVREAMTVLGRGVPIGADINMTQAREPRIASTGGDPVLRVTIEIVLELPDGESL